MKEKDHDLLIEVNTRVKNLCSKFDKLSDQMTQNNKDCSICKDNIYKDIGVVDDKIVDSEKRHLGLTLAIWLFGGVFFCIASIGGYQLYQNELIFKNRTEIEKIYTRNIIKDKKIIDNNKSITEPPIEK